MRILVTLFLFVLLPCIAFGAEEGQMEAHMVWRIIDFVIFVGFLYYYMKKPIVNFFKSRRESIENSLKDAEKLKADAEKLKRETEEKVKNLDDEINNIMNTFLSMSKKEKENALKEAEMIIKRMRESIEEEKASLINKANSELLKRMVSEAIENATSKLSNLNAEEHQNINKKYIEFIRSVS